MGKVSGNWVTGTHSGRACKHESIYTKVNKKTGACYSVKLCNPNSNWTTNQISKRTEFGNVSTAINTWISTNKVATAANYADYLKVKQQFDRQTKYATLRGMMYGRGMYSVASNGAVTVDITASAGSGSSSGGSSSGSGTTYTITLTASPAAGGSVGSGQATATAGTTVRINAVANSGYTFTRWSDNNTSATRDIVVNSDVALTAIFTANSSGDGDNSGGSDDGNGDM